MSNTKETGFIIGMLAMAIGTSLCIPYLTKKINIYLMNATDSQLARDGLLLTTVGTVMIVASKE